MADVAKLNPRKKIYDKVHDWEKSLEPLAPLSIQQRNFVLDLSDELLHSSSHSSEVRVRLSVPFILEVDY